MIDAFLFSPYSAVGMVLLACFGAYLAWRNGHKSRIATAAAAFRSAIRSAISGIPPIAEHWGPDVVARLPAVCDSIGAAVLEFKHFVPRYSRNRFLRRWEGMQRHCNEEIPKFLNPAEILYGSGSAEVQLAKETFHAHVESLLSYAQQT